MARRGWFLLGSWHSIKPGFILKRKVRAWIMCFLLSCHFTPCVLVNGKTNWLLRGWRSSFCVLESCQSDLSLAGFWCRSAVLSQISPALFECLGLVPGLFPHRDVLLLAAFGCFYRLSFLPPCKKRNLQRYFFSSNFLPFTTNTLSLHLSVQCVTVHYGCPNSWSTSVIFRKKDAAGLPLLSVLTQYQFWTWF